MNFQTNWQAHRYVDCTADWCCNHDNSIVPLSEVVKYKFINGGLAKQEFLKIADDKTIPKGSQQFIKAGGGNKQLIHKIEYEKI